MGPDRCDHLMNRERVVICDQVIYSDCIFSGAVHTCSDGGGETQESSSRSLGGPPKHDLVRKGIHLQSLSLGEGGVHILTLQGVPSPFLSYQDASPVALCCLHLSPPSLCHYLHPFLHHLTPSNNQPLSTRLHSPLASSCPTTSPLPLQLAISPLLFQSR